MVSNCSDDPKVPKYQSEITINTGKYQTTKDAHFTKDVWDIVPTNSSASA